MNSGKADNQLNIALDIPNTVRERTLDLEVGFDAENATWELIVKYTGSLERIRQELGISVVELLNEYAVIIIPENLIDRLTGYEEIEFIEKPKRLFFAVEEGRAASCINPVQSPPYNLTGAGTIVAVLDSGIDYSHPDFINQDGTTRILALWDQTIQGNPPEGYDIGTVYSREEINEALEAPNRAAGLEIVPSVDISGHGTHVAGIAAGNGRGGGRNYRGVAPESELLIVKLGSSIGNSFPRTTQLMQAIDFVLKQAVAVRKPIAVNISFGNSYGSHDGRSLLESYLNDMANLWKTNIVIGTGNDGASGRHTAGVLQNGRTEEIEFAVSNYETGMNLQIWKNYYDDFEIEIINPLGISSGRIPQILGTQNFNLSQTEILLYYGKPIPYNIAQEIYIEFIPRQQYIDYGFWRIRLHPVSIIEGNFNMWLPSGNVLNPQTKFLRPVPETTLTIPSTAYRAISVGAYDAGTDSYAAFSGRGFTRGNTTVKPDIVAPGVGITSASPGGGYTMRSGTSMATPFVAGSVALMMEWGIVRGNDPYLYGEKTKAYLLRGARKLPGYSVYPNPQVGDSGIIVSS